MDQSNQDGLSSALYRTILGGLLAICGIFGFGLAGGLFVGETGFGILGVVLLTLSLIGLRSLFIQATQQIPSESQ